MGFYTNENTYDRARGQKVIGEIQYIKSKYNLNQQALTSLAKYAQNNTVFKENNLVKLANLIHEVLISYGYTEEEITAFMIKNKTMFNSNYVDFRYRLALMYRFGLFDQVFFKHQYVLSNDFTANCYGTKDLYSILLRNEMEDIKTTQESLINISTSDRIKARTEYTFDMAQLKKFDTEMLEYLKQMKLQNTNKKEIQ